LRVVPLGSGSRGNATLVEFGATRLLVDAGLSARALTRRLAEIGVEASTVAGIFISHEHQDHARGVELFSKKNAIPVCCSRATLDALDLAPRHLGGWCELPAGGSCELDSVVVRTFPVPHDAAEPVGFILQGDGIRVGVATDLGHATSQVLEQLRGCHVLMIESNYDPGMLRRGGYPRTLQQRVSGRTGHLSNDEAAALLRHTIDDSCQAVILAHLSENNNTPLLARKSAAQALDTAGQLGVALRVAVADAPTLAVQL